jgi:ankyrin repeat protein
MAKVHPAPKVEDKEQQLLIAAFNNREEVVKTLLDEWKKKDDDVSEVINKSAPDYFAELAGYTPLHLSSFYYNNPEMTEILVKTKGIDVNKEDNAGRTPLWGAALAGHHEAVKELLAAPGINLNKAPTKEYGKGKSPLTIAWENPWDRKGCQEVVKLLEAKGAKGGAKKRKSIKKIKSKRKKSKTRQTK